MPEIARLTAAELVHGYRTGELSPVAATHAALDTIAARDGELNAFTHVDAEGALASAAASERRWRRGEPLGAADGVPTAIKDLLLTDGWPTLRGSWLVDEGGSWVEDEPSVARLREAGAVLLGKTTTPEFGWKGVTDSARHGVTVNPWHTGMTAGGSSGGSAAAVAAGMCTWALGTDGGGSVRIPAAFTGTVGLKPTGGLVPLYPPSSNGHLSHRGPITRSVRDAAALLDVLARADTRDWAWTPSPVRPFRAGIEGGVAGMRVAYSADLGYGRTDPEVAGPVEAAVGVLGELGARVERVDPGFGDPVEAFQVIWFAGIARTLRGYSAAELERVDPGLLRCAKLGAAYSATDYLDAMAECAALGLRMTRFHQRYHLLVTPATPIAAFPVGQDCPPGWPSSLWTSWTPYTYPFNMTRQPALSVPCGFTGAGLPVGLQIVAARYEDARVLRAGLALERHTCF
ncbi:amidase [Pseudonocardia eucalypti]|uniref:Amidase n=1 Tax=Pseudonocardia eucalypti TaxID=648755 RepID=A0ABP9QIR1_9PSEU|nr:aspartyl-tRNA(Asn)/glutamyl-tRNA(Gln) amidotransferase subunit A [Pseudonocardia eucalypti]